MHARRWLGLILVVGLIAGTGYMAYAAVTGGEYLVNAPDVAGCATPGDQYDWAYEAINYDIADDATLDERNADLDACTDQGEEAGQEVVTDDGVRIAGWYIPAANGAGPTATTTVVLVHGFRTNKSGILHYGAGLHDEYNLVAFDLRNSGRSTGNRTSAGVLEQRDLRAIIDWLERTKRPEHVGVLGNSLGAATTLAEAVGDDRVEAVEPRFDAYETPSYQVEARVEQEYRRPAYPATWAVLAGASIMAGVDVNAADPDRRHRQVRPSADAAYPWHRRHSGPPGAEAQGFFEGAEARGIPVDLRWCDGSGHNAAKGMPVDVCRDDYARWLRDFFSRAMG